MKLKVLLLADSKTNADIRGKLKMVFSADVCFYKAKYRNHTAVPILPSFL